MARLPGVTNVEEIIKKTTDGAKVYAKDLVRVHSDTQKIDKFFQAARKPMENELPNDSNLIESERTNVELNEPKNMPLEEIQPVVKIAESNRDNVPTIPDININGATDEDVDLENSLISGPSANFNKLKEKWKPHTTIEQGNITYIDPKESFKTRTFKYERVETKLTSVKQLRMEVENKCSMNLREILANLIFIACIDCHKSLIQHSTKLYLCNTTRLMEELFYETLLYDFQNFGLIKLSNPLPLEELFILGLNSQKSNGHTELGDVREIANQMTQLLVSKRSMLFEYFSLEMSNDGELLSLPLLLDGHTPFMGALPTYLTRLVTEVNWHSEKECFDTFSRQTAIFYSQPNPDDNDAVMKSEHWKQEHIIFPAIRRFFLPPTSFVTNGAILQIANLCDLYKVFERC